MTKMDSNDVTEIIDNAPDFAEPPQELKEAGLSQRDALLVICDEAQFWRSDADDVYATVPIHGHVEHHAIRSREFRNWMLHRLACRFTNNGRPASANENAVKDARAAVEARCLKDNVRHAVPLRVAAHDGAILIDCGTDDWAHYEVTDEGWSTVPKAPVPIIRSRRTSAFIPPADGGDFRHLRALLSHLDDEAFLLLVAWCVGAMLPTGPYPILILGGEQGSGKTTLVRLIQRIADPTKGDVMQPPRDDRDLIAMAKSNRVLALDNLSKITDELADSLCRLSTGSEIGGRALFSDSDLASFTASRPIVVNGIAELASRGDLADRSIVLRLPPLPQRMTEADWNNAVEAVLPATLAGLLDALAFGLRELDATLTPDVRMADFARFIIAAEPVLPWSPGDFLAAYQSNRDQSAGVLANFDCVACAVREFMDGQEEWSGLVSDLYRQLSGPIARNRPSDWPGNARWFGDRLRRCAPALRAIGIELGDRRTSDGVTLTIRRVASPATPASQNASDPDGDPKGDLDDASVVSASAH